MKSIQNEKVPFLSQKRNVALVAIFYTLLWGTAFPLVKLCMQHFQIADTDQASKCLVAGIRFVLSGLIILSIFSSKKDSSFSLTQKSYLWILVYGFFSTTLEYAFTYIGLSNLDGAKGAIYNQLGVFLILIFGGLFCKDDSLSFKKIIGCIVGFIGIVLTSASSENIEFTFTLGGEGMMLFAAIVQTIAYMIAKQTANTINTVHLVGIGQTVGGIILCIIALLFGGSLTTVTVIGVLLLIALALISSIAYTLSLLPLKYFPATEIASFNLLIPIFGVIMSGIILQENIFKLNYLFAILLIISGIFIINYQQKSFK